MRRVCVLCITFTFVLPQQSTQLVMTNDCYRRWVDVVIHEFLIANCHIEAHFRFYNSTFIRNGINFIAAEKTMFEFAFNVFSFTFTCSITHTNASNFINCISFELIVVRAIDPNDLVTSNGCRSPFQLCCQFGSARGYFRIISNMLLNIKFTFNGWWHVLILRLIYYVTLNYGDSCTLVDCFAAFFSRILFMQKAFIYGRTSS